MFFSKLIITLPNLNPFEKEDGFRLEPMNNHEVAIQTSFIKKSGANETQ